MPCKRRGPKRGSTGQPPRRRPRPNPTAPLAKRNNAIRPHLISRPDHVPVRPTESNRYLIMFRHHPGIFPAHTGRNKCWHSCMCNTYLAPLNLLRNCDRTLLVVLLPLESPAVRISFRVESSPCLIQYSCVNGAIAIND